MATNRTALFSRRQPGGVFTVDDLAEHPGDIWFVDSGHASKSDAVGFGKSPDAPFATLDYAVGQCTASNGDVIYLMPGHTETVTEAGGIDLDVIGITIRGLGNDSLRPQITYTTAATADIDIDAAYITIENVDFVAGMDDVAVAIDVNAAGFTIRNCRFLEPTTDKNFLIAILGGATNTSPRITVENCRFESVDAANTAGVSLPGTSNGCILRDNYFQGVFEDSAILSAGAVTRVEVTGNLIQNTDDEADSCIKLAANSTGIVAYNGVGSAIGGDATTNINCGAAVVLIENYSVDTGDRQGVLDPTAT
jgi:hypothetical protein